MIAENRSVINEMQMKTDELISSQGVKTKYGGAYNNTRGYGTP